MHERELEHEEEKQGLRQKFSGTQRFVIHQVMRSINVYWIITMYVYAPTFVNQNRVATRKKFMIGNHSGGEQQIWTLHKFCCLIVSA